VSFLELAWRGGDESGFAVLNEDYDCSGWDSADTK
jgi:hypothetical protein